MVEAEGQEAYMVVVQEIEMLLAEGLVVEWELELVAFGDQKEPNGTMKMVFVGWTFFRNTPHNREPPLD